MPAPANSPAVSPAPRGEEARTRLEDLYLALEGRLTSVLYRYLWDREEVRDVIQETFVRLWRARDRIDWPRAAALAYRTALNLAKNRRRGRRLWRWVRLEDQPGAALILLGPDQDLGRLERERAFRAALEALPERQRRVLLLCTFSELSYQEVGAILGISPGTVASRRNAAISRLRTSLKRWEAKP
jgi:RNA polymerase sigma-70 factor (ECF subfamily)